MRAELRLSIMRKLRSARRSAALSTTGTFTRPKEIWPFQIGRDMLIAPKTAILAGCGTDSFSFNPQRSCVKNRVFSRRILLTAMLATAVPTPGTIWADDSEQGELLDLRVRRDGRPAAQKST